MEIYIRVILFIIGIIGYFPIDIRKLLASSSFLASFILNYLSLFKKMNARRGEHSSEVVLRAYVERERTAATTQMRFLSRLYCDGISTTINYLNMMD
jgi:hypothetical protein